MAAPNVYKRDVMRGQHDHPSDTLRLMLLDDSSSYSFDQDSHEQVSDITSAGNEMSGTGYSRQTLSNVSVTVDDTDDEGVMDANDVTFSGLDAGTIQTLVVYQQTGGDDTSPADDNVIVVLDDANVSDLPLTTNGSDVTIQWDSEGIVNIA